MKTFYIPEGIADTYKYIVPSGDYVDIYDTNYLSPNSTYTFYRVYNDLDSDLYQTLERQTNNYSYGSINAIEINPSHNYIYRNDYPHILFIVCIYVLIFTILFNIFTSIIKKGGLLSGLL